MDSKEEAIQLITEEKHFSDDALAYFKTCIGGRDVGVNYHVISVFGSQSSGKSTLLNILFNTSFDTMDAQIKRQQTTKGIWVAHSNELLSNVDVNPEDKSDLFILDVEGSDGLERGEDQDFERKAALFAISVSEVLIVNMWEQQIGLYQGNNMALLKTVFEVNLSLFGKNKNGHKVLLLFVIRDHVGVTPISSLRDTITTELINLWETLSKPAECENKKLSDFFELQFVGLSHKLLQEERFVQDVKSLGDHFIMKDNEDYYFKPEYHHNLPLDGWTLYAKNCWELIEENRDLDLPTQQILVARFKTEEILNDSLEVLKSKYDSNVDPVIKDKLKLIQELSVLKTECLDMYDQHASKYVSAVYLEKRDELEAKIYLKFLETITLFIDSVSQDIFLQLVEDVNSESSKEPIFSKRLSNSTEVAKSKFEDIIEEFAAAKILSEEVKEEVVKRFENDLKETSDKLRVTALQKLITRSSKIINARIKDVVPQLLSNPDVDVWDRIMDKFHSIFSSTLIKYKLDDDTYDFQFGGEDEENNSTYKSIRVAAWKSLNDTIHDYLKEDTICNILRDRFELKFRYDDEDSPILWKNEEEVDLAFRVAKEYAFKIFDVLALIKTSDNVEVVPDINFHDSDEMYEDDLGIYHSAKFSHILNEVQKEKIQIQVRRQINVTVLDAKRSMIKTTTHIPLWIYAIIVVLGWNEFMMVIRNPLFVTLTILILVSFYFINKFDLWGPVKSVAQTAAGETIGTIKTKLRDFVLEEHEKTPKIQSEKSNSDSEKVVENEKS
ncbi:hypothetical protein Kpol_1037p42 [Vanderwaltozyma polyspora DSM 70294]|uniref:Protein SEY1 n=1 Tax=Vanderwaltozyma polyspora (strain ATCC 22028 / DSM 70294 / BCRC 21397 / CBS 2163 / NBRC 10782 / NRRL Y-8283 / UCD 57-17) TaxID=436907 RepID=SEY1_VANPO|nr:uncharacterized protein Kpol_1037p42 [Vanderwaltozyma polyspora DSM 70294]A7TJY3.1 RecName: Full=Protein SEY1 [Vanderwaltozyma polyspora DSM 70294]EDO17445.1 hypothetical protein Kpol_1037p42 [Vanderwaltozyma polyspora DSM 70294]